MPITATPSITISGADNSATLSELVDLKGLLSIDFADHDERLTKCLNSALARVQNHTGQILRPSTVRAAYSELYDWEDLPGPVADGVTFEATTYAGGAITLPTLTGEYPKLVGNYPAGVVISYQAGYETIPEDLSEAVRLLAANLFDYGTRDWKTLAAPYKRTTWAS